MEEWFERQSTAFVFLMVFFITAAAAKYGMHRSDADTWVFALFIGSVAAFMKLDEARQQKKETEK